ncbi:MAG: single-stranded DNA-binding protein [Chloroflexi bacterium]|jgi:single-strand DNA-binding protein|nr:single-stranded DNA-binding protein [Chloroflexota bacterium]
MANLIKIILIGRVGGDPEMRFTPDGVAVTSFSLAANRSTRQPDGSYKEEAEWFRISAWRKLAETCNQFLNKGKLVYVEGSLRTRTYDGKDGQKRTSLEVNADRVLFLDKQGAVQLPPEDARTVEGDIEPEDIPF